MSADILVCQSNKCRRAGAAAALLDIEELTAAVSSECKVRRSGCLRLCRQGPAAVVVKKQPGTARCSETPHTGLQNAEARARLVRSATAQLAPSKAPTPKECLEESRSNIAVADPKGKVATKGAVTEQISKPPCRVPALHERPDESRSNNAIAGSKGNVAMKGVVAEQIRKPLSRVSAVHERPGDSRLNIAIADSKENVAMKGVVAEQTRLPPLVNLDPPKRAPLWRRCLKVGEALPINNLPAVLERYSQWTVDSVVPVTAHSAVFHFSSTDLKRGTPHRRGCFRTPEPRTWHTTLAALVGENKKVPLPLVERDYTLISSAKDWENGLCEILIKIYPDGLATSWLHRLCCEAAVSGSAPVRPKVWLSPPVKTLSVPSLSDDPAAAFKPASVLLLLAGTGVVALPQILAHRDPLGKLGIATRAGDQMRVPIDVVYSCRRDDALMLPEIKQWCNEFSQPGASSACGIRNCMLLVTDSRRDDPAAQIPPFPSVLPEESVDQLLTEFQSLPNCQLLQGERLQAHKLAAMVAGMPQPCRFVVSGPDAFNAAVVEMLLDLQVEKGAVTILDA